jgi:Fe2+ transport system protein B
MKAMRISWAVALGLVLAGCAQVPTADVDAAKHAVDEARQAQAAEYAPQSWTAAQDAEAKLEAELDAQSQRWSALRSYTVASQLATSTKQAAEKSRDEAMAGKEQAKNEATTMMAQARDEAAKAKAAVTTAPRGKGTEADLASLKSDATSIDDTLNEMQKAFDAGDYIGAKTKAQAAMDAAKKIEDEIAQAKAGRRSA